MFSKKFFLFQYLSLVIIFPFTLVGQLVLHRNRAFCHAVILVITTNLPSYKSTLWVKAIAFYLVALSVITIYIAPKKSSLVIIGGLFCFLSFFIIAIEYLPLETLFSFFQRSCFFDFLFYGCFFLYITPLIFVISCPPYTSIRIIGDFFCHISLFIIGDKQVFHSLFHFTFVIVSTPLV